MTWYESNVPFFESEQAAVRQKYPELQFKPANGRMRLEGNLRFSAVYQTETIEDAYSITITFPENYPSTYPSVEENDGKIAADYHKNPGGFLCLSTPVQTSLIFRKHPTIVEFIEILLIPYLYRHSYIRKHGQSPFPDYPHGVPGLLAFYYEYFVTSDSMLVGELLYLLVADKYRGHALCPCRSGHTLRHCHGAKVLALPKDIVRNEFTTILDYLRKQSPQERK